MGIKGIVIIMLFVGLFSIILTPSFAESGCTDTKQKVEADLFTIKIGMDELDPGSPLWNELDLEKSKLEHCMASFESACNRALFATTSICYNQGYDIGKFDKSGGLDMSKVPVSSVFSDAPLQAEYKQCFIKVCNDSFNQGIEAGGHKRLDDEASARAVGGMFDITEEDVKEVVGGEELSAIYEQNCVIATASFGSPMAKEVQMLREIRDNQLLQTQSGSAFMSGFNTVYYSFAPTIAQWEQENPAFKQVVKITITPLITSLSLLNHVSMDSEAEVLGFGISLILLNIGMYFVAPAMVVWQVGKRI